MSPQVSVPVLSSHMTSTRAGLSTAGRFTHENRRRARLRAAAKKGTLVKRSRPSGAIPTRRAIDPSKASCRVARRPALAEEEHGPNEDDGHGDSRGVAQSARVVLPSF